MRFCVSVPVCAADHAGRTECFHRGRWRTSAFFFAMRCVAIAQRKRDGGQQTFRYVGDDDADGEHHVCPEPTGLPYDRS